MVDPVRIAPRHIGRALHNLLDNALRHTPAGGSIELRVYRREQGVEVAVHDTGEGVNPAELDLIFERFYRAEASRSRSGADSAGAGLGLAIARGMIEAHGGRIWAESNGQGATFRFTLPNSHLAAQSASAP
jgi:signal transduction histidine kinase